jgi:hypothetical protein
MFLLYVQLLRQMICLFFIDENIKNKLKGTLLGNTTDIDQSESSIEEFHTRYSFAQGL